MSGTDMNVHKRTAAREAADMVKSGMVVGLGTGSTAAYMIERLGELVSEGLEIFGIPTSADSEDKALKAGIPLTDFSA
ncbi:MAG: ribose 5-phosphate isomerase A, partial [Gluconobacter oxydans]